MLLTIICLKKLKSPLLFFDIYVLCRKKNIIHCENCHLLYMPMKQWKYYSFCLNCRMFTSCMWKSSWNYVDDPLKLQWVIIFYTCLFLLCHLTGHGDVTTGLASKFGPLASITYYHIIFVSLSNIGVVYVIVFSLLIFIYLHNIPIALKNERAQQRARSWSNTP